MDFTGYCNTCGQPRNRFATNLCYNPLYRQNLPCPACMARGNFETFKKWCEDAETRLRYHDRNSSGEYWMRRFYDKLQSTDGMLNQAIHRCRKLGWSAESVIDCWVEDSRKYGIYGYGGGMPGSGAPFTSGYPRGPSNYPYGSQAPTSTYCPPSYPSGFQWPHQQNQPAYKYPNTYTNPPWQQPCPTTRTSRTRSNARQDKPSAAYKNTYPSWQSNPAPHTARRTSAPRQAKPSEAYDSTYLSWQKNQNPRTTPRKSTARPGVIPFVVYDQTETLPTRKPSRRTRHVRFAEDEATNEPAARKGKPSKAHDSTHPSWQSDATPHTARPRPTCRPSKPSKAYNEAETEPIMAPSSHHPRRSRVVQDEATSRSYDETRPRRQRPSSSSESDISQQFSRQRPRSLRHADRNVERYYQRTIYNRITEETYYYPIREGFLPYFLAKLLNFGSRRRHQRRSVFHPDLCS